MIAFTLALLAAPDTASATLPSTTLPITSDGPTLWRFAGDKAVCLSAAPKVGLHFEAYSLADAKLQWRADAPLGSTPVEGGGYYLADPARNHWYIGTGPLTKLDMNDGTVKWTVSCEQLGFAQPATIQMLSGDRLLVTGSKKCKWDTAYDALKEPCFTMMDANTGKILWQYQTKSLEYEMALGYWARVAKIQGRSYGKDKRLQIETMLVKSQGSESKLDAPDPDRLAIAGERFEGVSLTDGSSLFKTKDKPGILRGAYDGRAFFREGDKVTAFNAGTGAEAWTFDVNSKGAYVYTLDDLMGMDQSAPDDMHDILISGVEQVSRVSTATGTATWTVKRGGMSWWTSKHAFLTEAGDKVTGYDWNSGAKLWEAKISSKPKPKDAGDYIVFVDGEKWESGSPIPPFQISILNGKTGQVAWTKKEIDGKKIMDWQLAGVGPIRLENEKGAVVALNVADGSPAAAPEGTADRYAVRYVGKAKALQCRDYAGNLLWERKGESLLGGDGYMSGQGCAVWVSKDGSVEVIGLADGATLWQATGMKDAQFEVDAAGAYLVVATEKQATIVKLRS